MEVFPLWKNWTSPESSSWEISGIWRSRPSYILSEDPTYITNHNSARAMIRKVDRDELLQTLVKYYLTH